jgi:hypothetical protein
MKKIITLLAIALFSINASAQEVKPTAKAKAKKEKCKTEDKKCDKKTAKAEGKKCCAKKA